MKTYGLIGYPLAQSFSQKYFSAKFERENINAQYLNFPIPSIDEFKELIEHHPYIAGMNVTIPYKEKVIPFLDGLDDTAIEIGAVNVIKFTWNDGKPNLKGYNSDTIGFTNSLLPLLKPSHNKALILGTGGAAKAVAYSLKKLGIAFRFVSRHPQSTGHVTYDQLTQEILESYHLIINTSPLGMYPNVDASPDIPYHLLGKHHLLYDLVYNPETTQFMQKGLEYGASVKNGLEMLHLQADAAWEIWNS
jgi:shikimate dehydrogenase